MRIIFGCNGCPMTLSWNQKEGAVKMKLYRVYVAGEVVVLAESVHDALHIVQQKQTLCPDKFNYYGLAGYIADVAHLPRKWSTECTPVGAPTEALKIKHLLLDAS